MIQDHIAYDARAEYDREIAEHRWLVGKLEELNAALEGPVRDQKTWCATVAERLREIAGVLEPHFQREEDSPLFREVPIQYPRFARALDRLMAEHEDFINDIQSTIHGIEELCEPYAARIWEIACKSKLIIAALRRHESEENDILQQAYWDDIGAID